MSIFVKIVEGLGIVRRTNPTALIDGKPAVPSFDAVGRQVMRLHQVRDLIATAYVNLASGTKTELKAGVAGAYFDLYQISLYNNSDVATSVILTDESTVIRTIPLPASSEKNISYPVPLKQSAAGVSWYVDMPDVTGTTVEVAAEFSQEV